MTRAATMNVAFRADASLDIGIGHVMRCLTLADALRERGANCHFICREPPGHLTDLIRKRGFSVHALSYCKPLERPKDEIAASQPAHVHWLGSDWQTDARQTGAILAELQPDWLVVDHYALDARWERAMKGDYKKLLVIDDLADRVHECDILLDQNWFGDATPNRYREYVPENCVLLLGPCYALLKSEYALLRSLMPPRDGIVKRILVFMGGSDPTNETGKVMDALAHPDLGHLVVDVVIGVNHPDPEGVAKQISKRPDTHLYGSQASLAGWMVRADLMISAGGYTSWERMCLGLPAIVISIADNQTSTNNSMSESGYIDFLGEKEIVTSEIIVSSVRRCMDDPARLKKMSDMGQKLVQGNGLELVCRHLWTS